jgi:hypothetical protein
VQLEGTMLFELVIKNRFELSIFHFFFLSIGATITKITFYKDVEGIYFAAAAAVRSFDLT